MIRRVVASLAALAAVLVPIAGATPATGVVPTTMATVVGTPGEGSALGLGQRPHAIVLRGGELYVADAGNNVVRAIRLSDGFERIVVGNGGQGFMAADATGPDALTTQLHGPVGIAFDGAGNLYVVESPGGRVRKVTPSGAISTVAGNGNQGFSGDGGPAVSATLFNPEGVAADAAGNLFIADSINNRIRRVDAATGIITTFAGTGVEGDSGDGGPATSARLRAPEAVALDAAGTGLLVADTGNSRIRRIDLASGTIVTVAGTGTAGASGDGGPATAAQLRLPAGITAHPDGGFLIADTGNHTVRIVDGDGRIYLVAGNGEREYGADDVPADTTNLYAPEGVAVGPDGTILIGDTRASRIRWVDSGGIIHVLAGTYYPHWNGDGPGVSRQISPPRGVAVAPNGDLYIADSFTHVIRRLGAGDGFLERVAGTGNQGTTGDGGPAGSAEIGTPMGLTVAPDGDVIFADDAENRVRRIDAETRIITTVAGNGDRGFSGDGGPATDASLAGPTDVAVTADGSVLVADQGNNRIRKVGPGGTITTVAGSGAGAPSGDGGPAATAGLPRPTGLALAADGTLYVSDVAHSLVRRISPSGVITTYAGNGASTGQSGDGGPATSAELRSPFGLDVDAAGNLFIADSFSFRIRRVDQGGTITSVAGNGRAGWAGDGGPPTAARLNWPLDVAVDRDGTSVYIADFHNLRIRRSPVPSADEVAPPPNPPPTTAPTTPPPAPAPTTPPPAPAPTTPPAPAPAPGPATSPGYWMVSAAGQVYAFGSAPWLGNAPLSGAPAVDLASTPGGKGYWVVDAAGSVSCFGDAPCLGGAGTLAPGETVTSLSATSTGRGYWLFTSTGRVVTFGDAVHVGDMAAFRLNGPVLDSVPTPTGRGYYMVASDGGVFAFGDARFAGSMGSTRLNGRVRALAPDRDGSGYWLVAEDGGIFAFDATFHGSMGGTRLNRPVTGIVASNRGYLMVAEDGGIFAFGDASFQGSLGGNPPSAPVASVSPRA